MASLGGILESVVESSEAVAGIPPGAQKVPQNAYVVGASIYGGPTDASSGHVGSDGTRLDGTMSIAELNMGTALGHLPYGTELYIKYNGTTVKAVKHDIGLGGAPVQGHARRIDLWYQTAGALKFNGGTGLVAIARVDGKPIIGPHDRIAELDPSKFGQLAPTQAGVRAGLSTGSFLSRLIEGLAKIFSIRGLEVLLGIALAIVALVMLARKSGLPAAIPIPV